MKKLPIGIQSFEKLCQENCYYVDKTFFVKKLVEEGWWYFLSRPRRFGKSLFLDTLKQAFLGKRELFQGLYLEKNWDWSKSYPVIHIDFARGIIRTPNSLNQKFSNILNDISRTYSISYKNKGTSDKFYEAIQKISEIKKEKVVILVDEYDKPILDNIVEKEIALKVREMLKDFYSVLKSADEYIKFVFITGVSKFSKVSLFSGLNQLMDITLHPAYATICGYTEDELIKVFKELIRDEKEIEEIRNWYNGYSWCGEKVYNPFDILLYFSERQFRPFWFESGNPSFLINLLLEKRFYIPTMESLEVSETLIGSFDVDFIRPENLLFQTGYLTIKNWIQDPEGVRYILTFPNKEVKISLSKYIINFISEGEEEKVKNKIKQCLREDKIDELKEAFYSLFAAIPYDWHKKTELSKYEAFYASIFYSYFNAIGVDVKAEDLTSHGRIDFTVIYYNKVYIFEFKVINGKRKSERQKAISPLKQIKEKKYWEKYLNFKDIYLIGVTFSRKKRNITEFEVEKLQI